jgi:anti-sigma factor RsiW
MNTEFQLKLQSYFDGELAAREAREVETALAADAEARTLLAELRNTGGALAGYEAEIKLPEAREFYWSKIQREIQRQETAEMARSAPQPWWSRFLIPAGAFAAVAIAGLFGALQLGWFSGGARSPHIETFLADSGAMTYRDEIERTTVVWLSYPVENEFADAAAADTIP